MKNDSDIFQKKNSLKSLREKIIDYKPYFYISLLLFLIGAFFYNKYTTPVYENSTSLLIKNTSDTKNEAEPKEMTNARRIETEISQLGSFEIINKALTSLGFEVSYYVEQNSILGQSRIGSFLTIQREYYREIPFRLFLDKSLPQALNLKFYITFLPDNKFRLKAYGKNVILFNYVDNKEIKTIPIIDIDKVYTFGEPVNEKYFNFKIILKDNIGIEEFSDKRIFFKFNNPNTLTLSFQNNLTIKPTSKNSSVLKIKLKGYHPEKITDFLNSLTTFYLDENLKTKNSHAATTVQYIDDQINDIADTLNNISEPGFQTISDLSFQGQQLFQKLNTLESEKNNLGNQIKYYEYLKSYVKGKDDGTQLLMPSSKVIIDPVLNQLVSALIRLNSEKALITAASDFNNPNLNSLNSNIQKLKTKILENVNSNLNALTNTIREVDYRSSRMSDEISTLPKTQLQLQGSDKRYKLNEALYTYLLQKRSDAQIERVSNAPDYKIVEQARSVSATLIHPIKLIIYLVSLLAGMLLPLIGIMIKDALNNKIVDRSDIEAITNKPIIGFIFHNYKKANTVIADFPKSSISESFRTIRTNLQIMSRGISKQVILITSSGSGEGKSFSSLNLASVFALLGKKTILISFDLRKPALYHDLGLNNIIGVSSYLSNRAILEDIIQPTRVENLDFISAGPVPPNPIELIGSNTTKNLISKLKEIYDYIIIDTAPIGVVTDAYFLMNYADLNIFVTRQNYTFKEMLANTLKSLEGNKISNIAIMVNDVYLKSRAYIYGYDSKYYQDKDEPSFITSTFGKLTKSFKKDKKQKRVA